jgi:hypothetical protein
MWWLVWMHVALARPPLEVEVRVDPPKLVATRRPVVRAGAVPLTHIAEGIAVDGRLDEGWTRAKPAPPLLARADGRAPPPTTLKVVTTPTHLVFGWTSLPPEHTATFVIDADGAHRTWWEITWSSQGLTAKICEIGDTPRYDNVYIPPRAVPCAPAEGPIAATGEQIGELAVPWAQLGPATTRMRLLWRVDGPDKTGGTWAARGGPGVGPEWALPLRVPQPKGRLRVDVDPRDHTWLVRLEGAADAPQTWTWRRTDFGQTVDEGRIEVQGTTTWTLPALASWGAAITLRAEERRALAQGFVAMVGRPMSKARIVRPVYRDVIDIAWQTSGETEALPVRVLHPTGRVLAETTVDLPRGEGILRVHAAKHWPREVHVEVPQLLRGTTRVERARLRTR